MQPRRLALLAYLASSKGALHRRDRLLLLFWGEQPDARARASLRQALYFLRRSLGDDILVSRGDEEIGLNTAITRVDVTEFESAVAEGRAERALELYRGDFLADLNVDDAPEFERWAIEKRRELRRSAVLAAWQLADSALAAGSHQAAVQWARRAVGLADYAGGDARRAMQIMASANDRDAALETYESLRLRMLSELETVPDAATTALAEEIRASSPTDMPVRPAQQQAVSPGKPRRRIGLTVGIAVAVLACALIGVAVVRRMRAASEDPGIASRVAVLPFTVRSKGQAGYLREGMATLLGLALDGAGRLRIIDPNAVLVASPQTTDLAAGERLASSLGAGRFVLGEIDVAGSQLDVAATMYDAQGHAQERATASGDEAHVFELVDSLARRLASMAMTDSSTRIANAAATSTKSLEAFKSFLAGETAIRSGHYRDAVASLQHAVAVDSTFGLAYYRLSFAREWTDGEISSDSAAALAEHFGSHLPDRDRKLLAARRAFVRRDMGEGERLSRDVIALYPTDADAWAQLGEVLFHLGPNMGRSLDDARVPFLTVLRFRPNDLSARVHLTRIAARAGDLAHLDEWSGKDRWLGDASEIGTFELAAMRAVVLDDQRARDTLVAALRRANELTVVSTVWRLSVYAADPGKVAELVALRRADGFASPELTPFVEVASGHIAPVRLADASLNRQHASQVALMLALPSGPAMNAPARRAHDELVRLIGMQGGAIAPVVVAARMLEARYPELPPLAANVALSPGEEKTIAAITQAMRAVKTEPARALEVISPPHVDEPTLAADVLYDIVASIRAEALHGLGRDAEAIAWLRSIGMNSAGSSSGIALATRRLAELEEASGAHEEAKRDQLLFATMWSTSDPELRVLTRVK